MVEIDFDVFRTMQFYSTAKNPFKICILINNNKFATAVTQYGAGGPFGACRVPQLRKALRPGEALRVRATRVPARAGHALDPLPLLQAFHGALPEDLFAFPAGESSQVRSHFLTLL